MNTVRFTGTIQLGSIRIVANLSREGEGSEGWEIPMPAGQTGVLTTRGGDAAGTITMDDEDHTILSDDILAVFWTDADGKPCCMYGFTATVNADDVDIALGGGDYEGEFPSGSVLPSQDTAVIVALKTARNISVEADDVNYIAAGCASRAVGILGEAAEIYPINIPVPFAPVLWDAASNTSTPLTGDPTKIVCYNAGLTDDYFQIGFSFLED